MESSKSALHFPSTEDDATMNNITESQARERLTKQVRREEERERRNRARTQFVGIVAIAARESIPLEQAAFKYATQSRSN